MVQVTGNEQFILQQETEKFQEKIKSNKCRVKSRKRSLHVAKGLEVPCQNTFKPAFIKRLIKVFVAKNLLLVHRSS